MIGLPVVIVCYLFVNIAYFAGLTKSELLSSPATALVSIYTYHYTVISCTCIRHLVRLH